MKFCAKCLNSEANPTIYIGPDGLCQVCNGFALQYDADQLRWELDLMRNVASLEKQVMVGLSGGKDSTATLLRCLQLGLKPLAFTFDIGYYPQSIFQRAKLYSDRLDVAHEVIDIRKYIDDSTRACYKLTADLYDTKIETSAALALYKKNREAYSVKSKAVLPFMRSCQICRKVVIRAYYEEAVKRNCGFVILGMNEWAHLAGNNQTSGIRRIMPHLDKPPVYVVHLPFIERRTLSDTCQILETAGFDWTFPESERGVSTNSNSCLFARASERQACKALGFHPDAMRLSREVTSGFITRGQAQAAICEIWEYDKSVRQVLKEADIL